MFRSLLSFVNNCNIQSTAPNDVAYSELSMIFMHGYQVNYFVFTKKNLLGAHDIIMAWLDILIMYLNVYGLNLSSYRNIFLLQLTISTDCCVIHSLCLVKLVLTVSFFVCQIVNGTLICYVIKI